MRLPTGPAKELLHWESRRLALDQEPLNRINLSEGVCGEHQCIRGYRLRVVDVLRPIGNGASFEGTLEDYPFWSARILSPLLSALPSWPAMQSCRRHELPGWQDCPRNSPDVFPEPALLHCTSSMWPWHRRKIRPSGPPLSAKRGFWSPWMTTFNTSPSGPAPPLRSCGCAGAIPGGPHC